MTSRIAQVTFCSMVSYAELSTESVGNYWIIRFMPDGRIVYLRNLRVISTFPSTALTRELERVASELQHLIREWQTEPEGGRKRELWWAIKEWLGNHNTAAKAGLCHDADNRGQAPDVVSVVNQRNV